VSLGCDSRGSRGFSCAFRAPLFALTPGFLLHAKAKRMGEVDDETRREIYSHPPQFAE
jgi:hypothetical protein